jgi:hypothetical protein
MYVCEFFRIYVHYRSRWFLTRPDAKRPDELFLAPDGRWAKKYYGNTRAAQFLRSLLQ